MRRSTWDSGSASPKLHCSTLTLEGTTVFEGPAGTPGIQRQPLQRHNIACSSQDALIRNGTTFKTRSPGMANNAAVWQPLDMSSMSAICCGTPNQNCQLSNPRQGISSHLAAWQKQLSACATNSRRGPEGLPLPSRQPSARGHSSAGSPSRQTPTPTAMAAHLVPLDRQASWDSHKWLAFTPPASLSTARLSRRVSQGLPGGAGKLTQPDDSALRLPPLTPPAAEASSPPASASLPEASVMPLALGTANPTGRRSAGPSAFRSAGPFASRSAGSRSATPTSRRSADPFASGFCPHPAGPLTAGSTDAQLDTLPASLHNQQAPVQQGKQANSAEPVPHAAQNAAFGDQLLPSSGGVCSGREQVEGSNVAMAVHIQEQQLHTGRSCRASSSVQQQCRHASTADDDTGQLGPPITRMRPAPPPATSGPAGKKSVPKQQTAADAADAFLFDALLCGWEQQTNDGDLYPLTLALEREGPEGADLQKLQLAAHMQLAGRSAGPPVPSGSPSRTKAGKARLLRTWRQE